MWKENESILNDKEVFMVSRFAWSSLKEMYEQWPEEWKQIIEEDIIEECVQKPDKMFTLFVPKAQEILGTEKAKEWFTDLSEMAWNTNKKNILREILWDMAGYLFPPFTNRLLLEGRGYPSYAGRNYDVMRQSVPFLSSCYYHYSSWWFVIGIHIAMILQLCKIIQKSKSFKKKQIFSFIFCSLAAGSMVFYYTFCGSGIMDYKASLTVLYFWTTWMVGL